MRQVPDIPMDSVEAAARDADTVALLEAAIANWSSVLAGVMQREADRKPLGRGPLPGACNGSQ